MAMFIGPTHSGWNGVGIKQPLTQEQTFLRMDPAEALTRKNDGAARIDDRRAAQCEADERMRQLKARKDQWRLGELPPGPMPPEGDVTIIEIAEMIGRAQAVGTSLDLKTAYEAVLNQAATN